MFMLVQKEQQQLALGQNKYYFLDDFLDGLLVQIGNTEGPVIRLVSLAQ